MSASIVRRIVRGLLASFVVLASAGAFAQQPAPPGPVPSKLPLAIGAVKVTPALQATCRTLFGDPILPGYNATGAGLAVGVMVLPIVCSLSEDALRAVPRSLREGAYALGSTRFDTSVRVVVPAALSGIMASFFLAITRAIGETMIVALAAGGLARMTLNPASETQTMTAYMVQIFLGDAPAFGIENLSSYAVAAVLFVLTFGMTVVGNWLLRMFREEYE